MPSSSFVFPGHTVYLEAAAGQVGRPDLARAAGRLVALTALANLCAQASRAHPTDGAAILVKASEFRSQLAIALHAADAMLTDVGSAVSVVPNLALTAVEDVGDDLPPVPDQSTITSRRKRGHA